MLTAEARRFLQASAGWCLLFFALVALQGFLTLPAKTSSGYGIATFVCGLLSTGAGVVSTLLVIAALVECRLSVRVLAALFAVAILSFWLRVPLRGANPFPYLLFDVGAVATAVALGIGIGRLLRRPGYLVPVLVAGGLVDIYSVFWGPTRQIMARPEYLSHFLFYYPILGTEWIRGIIGISDFIFAAFIFQAAVNFQWPYTRQVWTLAAACVVGFIAVWVSNAGLPMLPFIALFVIVRERAGLFADRENLQASLIVTTGVLAILVALALVLHYA